MENLKDKIENRLQFLLTIAIFFPTFVYSYFKYLNATETESQQIMMNSSGYFLVFCITSYIIFSAIGKKFSIRDLKIINFLVLANIGVFIFPVISLLQLLPEYLIKTNHLTTLLLVPFFKISMLIIIAFPVINIITMISLWSYPSIKFLYLFIKKIIKQIKTT